MTEQLSRRQVEWLRDAATEFASTQMKMTMKPEEVLQLTTALLAGMDSKPVAKVETVGVCWYADNGGLASLPLVPLSTPQCQRR